jgi:hypothetical protein
MAHKKAVIGELIKSDMSRRNIGENAVPLEFPDEPVQEERQAAKPEPEKSAEGITEKRASGQDATAGKAPEKAQPASKPVPKPKLPPKIGESGKIAPLLDYIAEKVESGGTMDEQDQQNFYDFMLAQALRYMRGFDAGKRFHQG